MRNHLGRKAGFTLIEFLVVLGIVALLASIAGLSAGSSIPKYNMQGASSRISSLVMLARYEAIKMNERVTFSLSSGSYEIKPAGSSNSLEKGNISDEFKGIKIKSIADCSNVGIERITFSASGSVLEVASGSASLGEGSMPVVITIDHNKTTNPDELLVVIGRSGIANVYPSGKFIHKGQTGSACN